MNLSTIPTHVKVTVHRAKGLKAKGKNGTNDAFVVMAMGKEKFQTSFQEKCVDPEWHEECELTIPKHGNKAEIVLTVFHHNNLGLDDFLGEVRLPLSEFESYERPRTRWYGLKSKPGKPEKSRGDLEVEIGFTVNSLSASSTSLTSGSKKTGGSLKNMAKSMGGSLASLGGKERKKFRKAAASIGHKIGDKLMVRGVERKKQQKERKSDNFDPGIISEEEDGSDFDFDTPATPRSSTSSGMRFQIETPEGSQESLSVNHVAPPAPTPISHLVFEYPKKSDLPAEEPKRRILEDHVKSEPIKCDVSSKRTEADGASQHTDEGAQNSPKTSFKAKIKSPFGSPKVTKQIHVAPDFQRYSNVSREDLMTRIVQLEAQVGSQIQHIEDLEGYIDSLLLRVMETVPRLLQVPYKDKANH